MYGIYEYENLIFPIEGYSLSGHINILYGSIVINYR